MIDKNLKNKYKNIEKYIVPDKLDMTLVPDIEDDDIGKYLTINEDGEPVWTSWDNESQLGELNDLKLKLKKLKDSIEISLDKIKKYEKDNQKYYEDFIEKIKIEKGKIEASITALSKVVGDDRKLVDDYIKNNNKTITDVSQIINSHTSSLEVMNKSISMQEGKRRIIGAYVAGSNALPTREWHNEVNPGNNAYLLNFMFEQDSGWIKHNKKHALMFSGNQHLEITNPFRMSREYATFTIVSSFTPYTTDKSSIMDFCYLFDDSAQLSIDTKNIHIKSDYSFNVNEEIMIAIAVDMQRNILDFYINGVKIKNLKQLYTDKMDLPKTLKLFNDFNGEVYDFKLYGTKLDDTEIKRQYDEKVDNYFTMSNIEVLLEADKAESILNSSEHTKATFDILNDKIQSAVTKDEYNNDKELIDGKITNQHEVIKSMGSKIEQLKDSITLKVDSKVWETDKKTLEDNITNTNTHVENNSTSIKVLDGKIEKCIVKDDYDLTINDIYKDLSNVSNSVNYSVTVTSTNGLAFRNGIIDTDLIVTVWKGGEDITSIIPKKNIIWSRKTKNTESDRQWNDIYSSKGNDTIHVTSNDVDGSTTFTVSIYDDNNNKLLSSN